MNAEIEPEILQDCQQLEQDLAAERLYLRALLENAPDPIYFKDKESRFIRCSRALANLLGAASLEELEGKTDFDYFSEEHARPAFEDEQRVLLTGQPLVGKVEKEVLQNGRVTWALTSKLPLRNEAGEIIGTFGISKDITAIKETETKLEQVHKQLLDTSRRAGMAEIATSVLHNVGNVLNSVNVSSSLVCDKIRNSKVANLVKAAALLQSENLADFLTNDPKGRQLPGYLSNLATHLMQEQTEMLQEIETLMRHIQHIKEIVSLQQSYARVSGVVELVNLRELADDAVQMNVGAFDRHKIKLVTNYADAPTIMVEKHKVLQIMVNVIRNAKYACDDSGRTDKEIIFSITQEGARVKISIQDNGIGIAPENLTRIFNHGFTTRKDGHGFGLHSGALAAKELGGSLTAISAGIGKGATFILELPAKTA